ncbi:hypothetical protein ALC57_11272 [Trachymyrmex cornetzi]|uniref:Uncharacterized protein n=1 Tax=Trachymyrmex cornetzi TaxID=471704 RepID=A0A195DUG7_9HYME|nr:hypothetical protein ALC57_11272 [Trachymyrmex cornetzi]
MRSKQQPRPSFRWPQQRGDNLTGKYPYVTSHAPTECTQWFFGSNLGWVLQSHQPIFEGPSMSSRPSEETSVDAQASSPFTALICRTGVLISTKKATHCVHERRDRLKKRGSEVRVLNPSPSFAQNLSVATDDVQLMLTIINMSITLTLVTALQERMSLTKQHVSGCHNRTSLREINRGKCLFSLCRSEYLYNPFPSFYLRS